ncbi:MAG: hypothetical protein AAF587_28320 [Bacteroidota bacterium]
MPDFSNTLKNLQNIRRERETQETLLFRSKEKLKQLSEQKLQLRRTASESDDRFQALLQKEARLQTDIADEDRTLQAYLSDEAILLAEFYPFSDPRTHMGQLCDRYPILLFPVRLETRFKTIPTDDGTGSSYQLWVRVFPDDCSVDSFESTLSETERDNAQDYWQRIWKAGRRLEPHVAGEEGLQAYIANQKKGAWKGLVSTTQAGRAYWITEEYTPIDPALPEPDNRFREDMIPIRTSIEELILVIPAFGALPSVADQQALQTYWTTVIKAEGDPVKLEEAKIDFENQASEPGLLDLYIPYNLKVAQELHPVPASIQVSFVSFPEEVDTQRQAWARAARIKTFPDRFVLLGYKGQNSEGQPQLIKQKLGNPIPNPLIVSPDPSEDALTILQEVYVEQYLALSPAARQGFLEALWNDLLQQVQMETPQADFVAEWTSLTDLAASEKLSLLVATSLKDDVKAERYVAYLSTRSDTKWLYDFEEAVRLGMGFIVDFDSKAEHDAGFDRLFVLGVQLSSDEEEAQAQLENLFHNHQFGNSGMSIIPQGSPTNNTEKEKAGYSETEDADEAYERYFGKPESASEPDLCPYKDGQRLADILGIRVNEAKLSSLAHFDQTDHCEAQAMNEALWNATLGYFLDAMMHPLVNDTTEIFARDFFRQYVSGRGPIPAIRIDEQPYGILPTTAYSQINWFEVNKGGSPMEAFYDLLPKIGELYRFLIELRKIWTEFQDKVAYVGKNGEEDADAHQILLEVLGLHASSVDFDRRTAFPIEFFLNYLSLVSLVPNFNFFTGKGLLGSPGFSDANIAFTQTELDFGNQAISEKPQQAEILKMLFMADHEDLTGPVIDDRTLSETKPIRAYSVDETNYIIQLIKNAETSLEALKSHEGFDNDPPKALLYSMLLHSLQLEYHKTGLQIAPVDIRNVHVDPSFVGIKEQEESSTFETKYDLLEQRTISLAGTNMSVAEGISHLLGLDTPSIPIDRMTGVLKGLEILAKLPTARLERLFAEHVDCCSHRLDAWLLGLVNLQLQAMRYRQSSAHADVQEGLYIGAYGWVEDLTPDTRELSLVNDLSPELSDIFDPEQTGTLQRDSSNLGYIHAPSLNHAMTGAVLRNAYESYSAEEYQINLSSERVRAAMHIIEGMQEGQSIGALLGYELERGLHDRHNEAEVDACIYELRRVFPLRSNQRTDTTAEGQEGFESITQIEARNVINGLSLLNQSSITGNETYPFGKDLKPATPDQIEIIHEELNRIRDINDAVADLVMAESVHQVVQTNYDRAAGVLDAYSKGTHPQTPEVARTPRSGITFTQRFGIHFPVTPAAIPHSTPRVLAEPSINAWLDSLLPDFDEVYISASYFRPTYLSGEEPNDPVELPPIKLSDLTFGSPDHRLMPIDLLYLVNVESDKILTALDDYILQYIHSNPTSDISYRPDIEISISYAQPIPDQKTIFELMPLLRSLRSLVLESRPLEATDMKVQHEGTSEVNGDTVLDKSRIDQAISLLEGQLTLPPPPKNVLSFLQPYVASGYTGLFDKDEFDEILTEKTAILGEVDQFSTDFLHALLSLSQFGFQQAGFGYLYDRKATIFASIYEIVAAYKQRWIEKEQAFDMVIADYDPGNDPDMNIDILLRAERIISTSYTLVGDPPDIPQFHTDLLLKKEDFDTKHQQITQFLEDSHTDFTHITSSVENLRTASPGALTSFDLIDLDINDQERQIVVFAEDMLKHAQKFGDSLLESLGQIQLLLTEYDTEAAPQTKVSLLQQIAKLLFGEEFLLIPHIHLGTDHQDELANCLSNSHLDQLMQYQVDQGAMFPLDDWLYGIARVREKLYHWEHVVMHVEGMNPSQSLNVTPLQFPFQPNDSWLALAFPSEYSLETDKLLYTAHAPSAAATQCGILVDEWTEVIPVKTETTGLSFHYDQPNNEAPQAMLLVTTPEFATNQEWKWQHLVNSLHETLDLAKLRAVEPAHIESSPYAQFSPATVSAAPFRLVTMGLNYAHNFEFPFPSNSATIQDNE